MFPSLGSQPQQTADPTKQPQIPAAQHHEQQHVPQHSQTELSTGSASLAAASGLLAIAGTAGQARPGQVLGSSESDGTPHPDHSTPSAAQHMPHTLQQQQLQQQQQFQYQQQPLMLLQQQQMLLHLQAAAGMPGMAQGGCFVPGQQLSLNHAQTANAAGIFFPAQQQKGQQNAFMAPPAAAGTQQGLLPAMAFNNMAQAGQLMQMQTGNGTSNPGGSQLLTPAGSFLHLMQNGAAKCCDTNGSSGAAAAAASGLPPKSADEAAAAAAQPNSASCRRSLALRGPCYHCGTTISSQWRSGPADKPVLCNACGLYYRKVQSLPDHTCQVAGALSGPCGHCGAEESPQWRSGPPEHPVLCDPCGRHFRKTKTLPKRKRRSLAQHFSGCHHCGSQFSPQWRGGPPDKPTLCNACGLHYRKTKGLPERPPQAAQTLMDLSRAAEQQQAIDDAALPGPGVATAATEEGPGGHDGADSPTGSKAAKSSRVAEDPQQQQETGQQQPDDLVPLPDPGRFYGGTDITAAAATATANGSAAAVDQHEAWAARSALDAAVEAAAPLPTDFDLKLPQLPDDGPCSGKLAAAALGSPITVPKSATAAAAAAADFDALLSAAELTADDLVAFSPPFSAAPVISPVLAAVGACAGDKDRAADAVNGGPVPDAGIGSACKANRVGSAALCKLDDGGRGETAESSCSEPQASGTAAGSQGAAPAVTGGIAEGIPVMPQYPMAVHGAHLQLLQQQQQQPGVAVATAAPGGAAAATGTAAWGHMGLTPGAVAPAWGPMGLCNPASVQPGMFGLSGPVQPGFGMPFRPPMAAASAPQQQQQQQAQQNDQQVQQTQPQQQHVAQGTALQPYDHLHMQGLQMAPMIHMNWHYQQQQQAFMMQQQLQQQQQQDSRHAAGDASTQQPMSAPGVALGVPPGGMPGPMSMPGQMSASYSQQAAVQQGPQGPASANAFQPPCAFAAPGGFGPMMPPGFGPMPGMAPGLMDPTSFQAYQQHWQQWQQHMMMQQQVFMQQQQHMYYQQQLHMQQQQQAAAQQQVQHKQQDVQLSNTGLINAAQQPQTTMACAAAGGNAAAAACAAPGALPSLDAADGVTAMAISPVKAAAAATDSMAAPCTTQGGQAATPATCQAVAMPQQQTAAVAAGAAVGGAVPGSGWPSVAVPPLLPGITGQPMGFGAAHPYGHMCMPQSVQPVVIVVNGSSEQQQGGAPTSAQAAVTAPAVPPPAAAVT